MWQYCRIPKECEYKYKNNFFEIQLTVQYTDLQLTISRWLLSRNSIQMLPIYFATATILQLLPFMAARFELFPQRYFIVYPKILNSAFPYPQSDVQHPLQATG